MIPVYMINGFLESGKTEFISFTLSQPYFKTSGNTLLIVCEEGENSYDDKLLKKTKTIMEIIEDKESFTPEKLSWLERKHKAQRVIIEFNGMWNPKEIELPSSWEMEQQITIINGATFPMYYTNMKSLVAEQVRGSELIIFNRCDGIEDLASYKRNVKAVNAKAEVVFEGKDGEINQMFEEDLPYDLKSDELVLDNEGYGIWYIDSMDNMDRYIGKTVVFDAMAMKPKNFPDGVFVPGRMALTCCADDMAFIGYACKYEGADELKPQQWIRVKAVVKKEYFKDYKGEGPVLYAQSVTPTEKPKDDVITFGQQQ
ncbi:MAG: GTPase [Lachnospiraceae bacterium]|nr:GTPase [Candidatus Merdinaster equi]